jgi:hypothetical protein
MSTAIINETPVGVVDGTNTIFTLAYTPTIGSVVVYLGPYRQEPGGIDYTRTIRVIVFVDPPTAGSRVRVDYQIESPSPVISTEALITAESCKALIGPLQADSIQDDVVWTLLAEAISSAIQNYCNEGFELFDGVETRDGTGTGTLFVERTPISAVTAIRDVINNITYTSVDWVVYRNKIRLRTKIFCRGMKNIEVTYSGGQVPSEIKRAAELICVQWFNRRFTVGKMSESASGSSVSVDNEDIPALAKTWMDRRVNVTKFIDTQLY